MIRISVIIPVYNAAPFLDECIQSLLSQTASSIEFIFVDDGSTDNSLNILKSYRDARIHILSQANAGVSVARNTGLSVAIGEYIGFMDADDVVESNMYDFLYSLGEKYHSDIVVSRFRKVVRGRTVPYDLPFLTEVPYEQEDVFREIIPFMLKCDRLNSVTVKIFKNDLLRKHQISFPDGLLLGEDAIFSMKAFACCSRVVFTDFIGYKYREVPGSATRDVIGKDYLKAAIDVYQYDHKILFPDRKWESEFDDLKKCRLITQLLSLLSIYQHPDTGFSQRKRYSLIRETILNTTIQSVLRTTAYQKYQGIGFFRRFVLTCVNLKLVPIVWICYAYSNYRNSKR